MTPARFLILLGVIVLVLFAIALAVQQRSKESDANSTNSWTHRLQSAFAKSQAFDALKDADPTPTGKMWNSSNPAGLGAIASLNLRVKEGNQKIRRATFKLSPGKFALKYTPSPDEKSKDKQADPDAVKFDISEFDPDKGPLTLVFLKHGGTLNIVRKGPGPLFQLTVVE